MTHGPMRLDQIVGQRISDARRKADLRPSYMARALGLSLPEYVACEHGQARFKAVQIARIAKILKIEIRWIFFGDRGSNGNQMQMTRVSARDLISSRPSPKRIKALIADMSRRSNAA